MDQRTITNVVLFQYTIDMINPKSDDFISCHIREYNLFFKAKNEKDAVIKADIMIKSYLDFLHKQNNKLNKS